MKINGQLEEAGLEQLASDPTPAFTGRSYFNTTLGLPKVYNGSAWLSVPLGQTTVVTQNSGLSCTVNWATGLVQIVVLTNNTVISFSNPQAGLVHTLIVQQSSTAQTTYRYTLNMTDQDSKRAPYQPIGVLPVKGEAVYEWYYSSQLRPGQATIPAAGSNANPSTPGTAATGMAISAQGDAICFGQSSSPFSIGFQVYDTPIQNSNPLGLASSASAAAAATVVGVAYSPDAKFIFTACGTSPFLQGWFTERLGVPKSVLADPGTVPTGAAKCVAVHPSGMYVGVGHATTPFMSVYPITGVAYGTKLTNPVTLPAAQVNALAWCPQGDFLAVGSQTTPFLQVWAFTSSSGLSATIGAVASNPVSLPSGGPAAALGNGICWRPQGDYIAMGMSTSPYLYIVPFNRATGTFGTAIVPGVTPPGSITTLKFTPDGQYLVCGSQSSTYLLVYDFSSFTTGTPIAFDGSGPAVVVNDLAIHPNGETVFISSTSSPFVLAYGLPTKPRSYIRLNV